MRTKTLMDYRLVVTLMSTVIIGCESKIMSDSELAVWKADSLGCKFERSAISKKLVESNGLVGLTRLEVEGLLGSPDAQTSTSMVYYIGRSWRCDSLNLTAEQLKSMKLQEEIGDRSVLLLNLDTKGLVLQASIPVQ